MKSPFYNKKIGIWGFGIVGKSAFNFFKQITNSIQILTLKKIESSIAPAKNIIQSEKSIQSFLQSNDFIITSPGIPLHKYEKYQHKFVTELDIYTSHINAPTIAITGTLGKTTITQILSATISSVMRNSYAAGNIGYPLLNLYNKPIDIATLELSSFQLQHIKAYAPDLAIWTNFYENHLDHHKTVNEYFKAKCNIIKFQKPWQRALLPLNLHNKISKIIPQKSKWFFFTTDNIQEFKAGLSVFFIRNKTIYLHHNNTLTKICDTTSLPHKTFLENLLILTAASYLEGINLDRLKKVLNEISLPHHRIEVIATINQTTFFNDSKATVWQATLEAIKTMPSDKPIYLFLGGLSKGADKTPLFESIKNLPITIFSFGDEAQKISDHCKKFHIPFHTASTLDESFEQCIQNIKKPCSVLFSPSGSSFDLFKNYEERGNYFMKLVKQYENMLKQQGTHKK